MKMYNTATSTCTSTNTCCKFWEITEKIICPYYNTQKFSLQDVFNIQNQYLYTSTNTRTCPYQILGLVLVSFSHFSEQERGTGNREPTQETENESSR
jgi:hypothetical protein